MTMTTTRRRDRRFPLLRNRSAVIEIDDPQRPGERRTFQMLDLSIAGLSFGLPHELDGIQDGASIEDAVLRIGPCEITGRVVIRHVGSAGTWSGLVCGALFHPGSYDDQLRLMSVIAGMGAMAAGHPSD